MNKYKQIILATALTGLSSSVISEPLSYTSVTASYQIFSSDIDGIPEDLEGDGLVFEGSFSIAPNFALLAGYATGSGDVTSSGSTLNTDVNIGMIGALFHTPLNATTDFVGGLRLLRAKTEVEIDGVSFGSETSNGNELFLGIRAMASEKVELRGFLERSKYEDSGSENALVIGAGYYIDKTVSLNFGYYFNSDGNTLSFGLSKFF